MADSRSEIKPTVAVVLDTRRQKANSTYPVRLRITYQRERKYYTLKLDDLTRDEWEKLKTGGRLKDRRLLTMRDRIAEYETLAKEQFKKLPRFTFERFENLYFSDHSIDTKTLADDVYAAFAEQIQKLREQGRIATAIGYETTMNSLKGFRPKLRFSDLSPKLLEDYENQLVGAGRSITTVGIYLRNLRVLVNQAKAKGQFLVADYPFGKGKYEIPAGRNVKKALTLAEIEKIYNYLTEKGSMADRAKDFWFFSYLCNGINIKDICLLRWRDVDNERITFVRAKTVRTKRHSIKPIVVVLTNPVRDLIEKWGNSDQRPDNYVFPILTAGISPERERVLVQNFTQSVNTYVKRMAVELAISKPVTTYTARHSFATVLKRSGAPNAFIGESLGHSSSRTTESYLDSFEDDMKRDYANVLLNFAK